MRSWLLVGALTLLMIINFGDRAVFGLSALPIMADLRLTNAEFGVLGSAFFVLFSPAALVVGWLADRWSPKWTIAGIAFVLAAGVLPLAGAAGFWTFLVCRGLLGAGEGPAFPMALHAAFTRFPDERRTLVTSVIATGAPLGAGLATLAIGAMIQRFGWHVSFGILGALSFAWGVVWVVARHDSPNVPNERVRIRASLPIATLFLNRTVAGVGIAAFAFYCTSSLAVIWFPPFLRIAGALTEPQAAAVLSAGWLGQAAIFPVVGLLSQWLQRRGFSSENSRVAPATVSLALAGIAMAGAATSGSGWMMQVCVVATFAFSAAIVATGPAIIAQVVPAGQRAFALGGTIAFGSLGGIFAPFTFGRIVDLASTAADGYRTAFLACGALVVAGALVAHMLARPTTDRERLAQGPRITAA
jgi:ACS family D-galactonate transporter-like MFS transporter